jgi:hypothetical protein
MDYLLQLAKKQLYSDHSADACKRCWDPGKNLIAKGVAKEYI